MITVKRSIETLLSKISKELSLDKEEVYKILEGVRISKKYIYILPKKCIRCALCYDQCPVEAIVKPSIENPAEIVSDRCVKCEICARTCPVNAIDILECTGEIEGENLIYRIREVEVEHRTIRLRRYHIDLDRCVRCGTCSRFCPTGAIEVERGKSFKVDLDRCVGCRACERVCPRGAISVENEMGEIPFHKEIKVDNSKCVKCLVCISVCPIGIIREVEEGIEIDVKSCIFCGRCESVCPVHAIEIKKVEGVK
ncbi:MAG TPA: 4Fe-4S dicluster domain-containing protein [Methanothermococcus okinawensis]|uniref:4Fe-4S dicluster domain-containing protein n=1 Tax=Methanothermococcus okinawensis TaxID=155863 RepID=A0A833EBD1_9EURY|nr:4Fe-4S dicluster domain-containing protein [Methanothermococcus okinawensis]